MPTEKVIATATSLPTSAPVWTICTGMEGGFLNVRSCAGTGCMSIAILREGRGVSLAGVEEEHPSGRWVLITSPTQGWVNASYICEDK